MPESSMFYLVAGIGSVLISMTFHEAMHAFVGYWLGDDTAKYEGRLTLNPLQHIDPVFTLALPIMLAILGLPIFGAAKPVPFNPARLKWDEFGAALVGLAGPLTNLFLAVLAAGVLQLVAPGASDTVLRALAVFVSVNVGFFVFNMIPFPPLDGSRAFYALAPEPVREVMRQIEGFGLAGLMLFMFVALPALQPILIGINESILRFLGLFAV